MANKSILQANISNKIEFASCKPPSNIKILETTVNSAKITWRSKTNGIAWKIKWRKRGEDYSDTNTSELLTQKEYIITGLDSDSKYYFKLQTLCSDNSESNWSSNEYFFITNFNNPSNCNLNFELKEPYLINDSLYPGNSYFYIQNNEFVDGKLGVDVFLKSVNLTVAHSWTHDLEIKLWSPSNKSVILASDHGISSENIGYGNPNDTLCAETIKFSDDACIGLNDESQYIGHFKPDYDLSTLYDSTSPYGVWKLEIIDKSLSNSGTLEFVELDFEPIICPVPKNISIIPQNENSVLVNWFIDDKADSLIIHSFTDATKTVLKTKNSGSYLIENITNIKGIALQSICNNDISVISCTKDISLLCGAPQLREGFDSFDQCKSSCEDCINSGIWFNASDRNWLINEGATTTENTGPDSDLYGNGKYLYFESSTSNCSTSNIVILQSECIFIEPEFDGCGMEFNYHMYGIDIGSLALEISTDNGTTWNTLFHIEKIDSNAWIKQNIDLTEYENRTCNFRFVAQSLNKGNFGDIAIDDIIFYNSIIQSDEEHLYYPDRDNDGFGKDTIGTFFCNLTNDTYVKNNEDCDDFNPSINPDAEEIPCNFIDENCNGMEDDQMQDPFEVNIVSLNTESCDGSNDGAITLSVSNGIPPYNFLWSNMSTDSILTDIGSGKYWCEITDKTGCGLITDTFEITHLNPFEITIKEIVSASCNGLQNGSIAINVSDGGISPFKYLWNTGDTTKNLQNVSAGIYSVEIVDSTGCKVTSQDIELTATTTFDIAVLELVKPSCYGGQNGSLKLRVEGGIPPYSFEWSNGSSKSEITEIKAGDYFCTITDSELCFQEVGPITINQPDSIDAFISTIDDVTCIGQNNGAIEIGVKGGVSPYTFEWFKNNKIINRNDDLYNISSGLYTVNIRDINGCLKTLKDIQINTIDSITVTIDSITDVNCSDTKDGAVFVSASKGYGQYYYYWSNGEKLTDTLTNLNNGIYSVTVVDDLGCKQVLSDIEVENLNIPIDLTIDIVDSIKCFGDNSGKISVQVLSESSPYDFNWSAGTKIIKSQAVDTLLNLSNGIYNVTVTDNEGCVGTSSYIELTQPDKLEIKKINIDNILCFGDNTGKINLEIEGGIKPYFATWSNELDGLNIIKLNAGDYKAIVTDNNECKIETETITINQPDELKVTIESNPALKGQADGSARLLPSGGVSPYYFTWDENANSQTGNEATNLSSGWYNVTLEDYNECIKEIRVFIAEIDPNYLNEEKLNNIYIYPNPIDDHLYIHHDDKNSFNFTITNINGVKIDINIKSFDKYNLIADVSTLPTGLYILGITTGKKHYIKRFVVIH